MRRVCAFATLYASVGSADELSIIRVPERCRDNVTEHGLCSLIYVPDSCKRM